MPATLEKSRPSTTDAVDFETLFRAGDIVVTRWRCRVREAGMSASLSHKWHTIQFVHTGAFRAYLSEGAVHVDSTRTLLAAPRNAYMVTRQFGPDVSGSAILISPKAMRDLFGDENGDGKGNGKDADTRLLHEKVTPRALLMQHLILRMIEEGASPRVIAELGLTLAAEAFRDPCAMPQQKRARVTTRTDAVAMAQAILAANYEKPVRLEAVARAVELSPYHLCRAFKLVTGVHMHQYLNRLRLRASLEHVAEPRLALADIAHHHGFSSHSHFAAAFRKEFRITPSEARSLATRNFSELRRTLGFEP
jgi:AraC family transcriptional regulator